jgi:small conductance mechanosensitive channel
LAVGFGAQHLVRDLVSGFFCCSRTRSVGDAAIINGTGGLVADHLRTVVLRDQAGVVHVFPNGAINTLANATMDWSAYVIDVAVSYKQDTDKAIDIMRRVADEMKAEEEYGLLMLEPIEIFGVDNFADSAVIIKARFKTQLSQQHSVGRVSPPFLKAFDAEGVEWPPAAQRASSARTTGMARGRPRASKLGRSRQRRHRQIAPLFI